MGEDQDQGDAGNESDMDLDLLAESESDSEASNHSNQVCPKLIISTLILIKWPESSFEFAEAGSREWQQIDYKKRVE